MNNGLGPLKNVLPREQERPRRRYKPLSQRYPSHRQRMTSHAHRVTAELPSLTEPPDSEGTYIDPGVDIPADDFDTFRLRAFQMAYRRGEDTLDPLKRFVSAIVESSQPIHDDNALHLWHEQVLLPRQEARKAMRRENAAHAKVQDVTHACV